MRFVEKDKPIRTIPKGVWESSRPNEEDKKPKDRDKSSFTASTDIQKNGTPIHSQDKQ